MHCVDIPRSRHTISRNAMGAGVHRSDAYAARKVSGGKDKRVGVVETDFNLANSEGANIYSRRDGDADFKFLARDTELAAPESDEGGPPYVDNRPMLVAGKPELREYKAVFVGASPVGHPKTPRLRERERAQTYLGTKRSQGSRGGLRRSKC